MPSFSVRSGALFVCLLSFVASPARAQGFELSLFGGWTAPTYEQTFDYSPSFDLPNIPGFNLSQQGSFALNAKGALAFGAAIAYFPLEVVGVEVRVDTVDFDIENVAPTFIASLDLPAPLPPLSADLDLGIGSVDVERLFPISFNVKARSPGPVRIAASGGLSYLPRLRAVAIQEVGLGVTAIGQALDVESVVLQASALPQEGDEGLFGFNGGLGFEIGTGSVAFHAEGRVFWFQTVTLTWRRTTDPVSQIEETLLTELEQNLPPIEFEPVYFQVTGGITIRF